MTHNTATRTRTSWEVTKKQPCPICNKPDWCLWLDSEATKILCNRTLPGTHVTGWNQFCTTKDKQPIFKSDEVWNSGGERKKREGGNAIHYPAADPTKIDYISRRVDAVKSLIQDSSFTLFTSPSPTPFPPSLNPEFPSFTSVSWTDTGLMDEGAVEKECRFIYTQDGGSSGVRVVRRQWSDRRPVYKARGKNRSKLIFPQYLDSEGRWRSGNGHGQWDIYRHEELKKELLVNSGVLFLTGGELATQAAASLGLAATCTHGGEGSNLESLSRFMDTRSPLGDKLVRLLCIIPDWDATGVKAAIKTQASIWESHPEIPVLIISSKNCFPSKHQWEPNPKDDFVDALLFLKEIDVMEVGQAIEQEILRANQPQPQPQPQQHQKPQSRTHSLISHVPDSHIRDTRSRMQDTGNRHERKEALKASESEAADLLSPLLKDWLAYSPIHEGWMAYDSDTGIWNKQDSLQAAGIIKAKLKELNISYTARYLKSVLELMASDLRVEGEAWNPQGCVPFSNGVLELGDGGRRNRFTPTIDSAHRMFRFTYRLDYEFNPKATCPKIEKWLNQISSPEIAEVLIAYLAACHRGMGGSLQVFLELVGAPGTGKGTFMRLMSASLGRQAVVATTLKHFEGRFESSRFYRGNKRCIQITDAHEFGGDPAQLKAMTGGDLIRVEEKHEKYNDDDRYSDALIVLAANESPKFTNGQEALSRRRIPVILSKVTNPENAIALCDPMPGGKGWSGELVDELPGLFNWILRFSEQDIINILKNKYRLSELARESQIKIQLDSNPLMAWAEECLCLDASINSETGELQTKSPVGVARKSSSVEGKGEFENFQSHLYPSYRQWISDNGFVRFLAITQFKSALIAMCKELKNPAYFKRTAQGSFFFGIILKSVRPESEELSFCGIKVGEVEASLMEVPVGLQVESPTSATIKQLVSCGSPQLIPFPPTGLIEKNEDEKDQSEMTEGTGMLNETALEETVEKETIEEREVAANTSSLKIPKKLKAYESAIRECLDLYAGWGVTLPHLIEMAESYSKSNVLSKYQGENLTRFFNVHQQDWLQVWTTLSQADAMLIS
jgi:phage/plasmid-associated DNA primase